MEAEERRQQAASRCQDPPILFSTPSQVCRVWWRTTVAFFRFLLCAV